MQTYLMLKNYVESSLPARGLLVKIMFKELKEIANNRFLEFEGQRFPFTEQEIPSIMGTMQMDIVSEDLLTLLIAMKDYDGNYYRLLDKKTRQLMLKEMISVYLRQLLYLYQRL